MPQGLALFQLEDKWLAPERRGLRATEHGCTMGTRKAAGNSCQWQLRKTGAPEVVASTGDKKSNCRALWGGSRGSEIGQMMFALRLSVDSGASPYVAQQYAS